MLFNKAIASLKHLVFGRTFSGKLARKGYLFILPAVVYFSLVYFYPCLNRSSSPSSGWEWADPHSLSASQPTKTSLAIPCSG